MLAANEIEVRNGIHIMFNNDGSTTVFNDNTGVVIEKNIRGEVLFQESDNVYVSAVRGMIQYGMNNFVKAPLLDIDLFINPIIPNMRAL
jgi:hypothetical protein